MEPPVLFYAWQSDTEAKFNRNFIGGYLKVLGKKAATQLGLPEGLIMDRDTKDVPGTPEITTTILEKINRSAVFVADVSFVGESFSPSEKGKSKKLPNPNVLLELGYAFGALGPDRTILVMNTKYGPPEDQVFDLRNRRFGVCYSYDKDSDIAHVKQEFHNDFSKAILGALASTHNAAVKAERRLNEDCLKLIASTRTLNSFTDEIAKQCGLNDFRATIDRLLDLELLFTEVAPDKPHYGYHYTYIGELVRSALLKRL
jgi:hypothetical protein